MTASVRPLAAVLVVLGVGCATAPRLTDLGMEQSRVRSDGSRPLVVEWPSSDRAELEALARRGPVAVRYDATGMRLLPRCMVAGQYAYSALTPKKDRIVIRNVDELHAQVPLGAAKLEGVLARTGELEVAMTVVGRFEATSAPQGVQGDCSEATHVIGALTVGAFDFLAGASSARELGAGAPAPDAGAKARTGTTREVLNRDGDESACAKATASDRAPPYGCGAVMRVDLVAFAAAAPAPAAAAAAAPAPAPSPSGPWPQPTPIAVANANAMGMVRIPAGRARLGASDLPGHALPVQELAMPSFDIDLTEVTIRAYARCVDEGPCTPPDRAPDGHQNGCGHARDWFRRANTPPGNEAPVTCVSPEKAAQYCAFVNKRLPTEEEWEYAARGTDFRRYPWGNADPTKERAAPCHWHGGMPCLVGAMPGNKSPFGVLDMAGSKMEITVSASGSGYKTHGSHSVLGLGEQMSRTAYRDELDTYDRPTSVDQTSFRCAASVSGAASPRARDY